MRNKLIISFFCVLLAVCALAGLFIPDKYYSEREKRTLAQIPKFSIADFFSGKFGDKLETYLADQVPLRDKWITLKTYLELGIGKHESGARHNRRRQANPASNGCSANRTCVCR